MVSALDLAFLTETTPFFIPKTVVSLQQIRLVREVIYLNTKIYICKLYLSLVYELDVILLHRHPGHVLEDL